MSIKSLTGINKAAVLLICLGEEATAKIFQELSDDEIRKVTRTMATIDHIPESIKDKVSPVLPKPSGNWPAFLSRAPTLPKRPLPPPVPKNALPS